ncbi:putative Zn(II)2Cys6 transcription factor [Aspergillus steynii IBT 23096]|uniref:Putative Zn(II)2Cys6 transcription factor n=1 Tax=Aspergillus steynii IBT 23096 TaxID=1392250 RepID=A0A2I2GH76_9EURO|nr:putative Zn(II)2Cys6 transcription factor [Aspergillus steynii IBT 23096]PLB52226.1 putative Zn(II)2Cys6 transcription factor [Aspergillus steynii IBT 23096]
MSPSTDPYISKTSRRAHRKSRLGCINCKKRRVKCDEEKPTCTNCLRHSVECDYGDVPQQDGSNLPLRKRSPLASSSKAGCTFISASQNDFKTPKRGRPRERPVPDSAPALPDPPCATVANRPFEFTATDMALFHHFLKSSGLAEHMVNQLSRLGFVYHYVLRLLLAFSAFQIVRRSEDTSLFHLMGAGTDFYTDGERHFDVAVAEVAAMVPLLNRENAPALYAASLLIFLCSVTKGPRPGEYLAFRDDGESGCLSLFMGMRSMIEACNSIADPAMLAAIHAGDGNNEAESREAEGSNSSPDSARHVPPQYQSALSQVHDLLATTFQNHDTDYLIYCQSLERLSQCYDVIFDPHVSLTDSVLWPQIFGWLYMLPDRLLLDLRDRRPLALVIFSHYTVLLHVLDEVWMIQGWPRHVMHGISQNLDPYHRLFVEWPMQQIGISGFSS